MAINKKLIHFQTKKKFEEELAKGNLLNTSIVFIKETREIWTHGQLYNCSDLDGYVTITDLDKKVDKDGNKVLSDNNFTDELLQKLNGIAKGAEVNVQSDWNATSGDSFIKNKPTIPDPITEQNVSDWGFTKNSGTVTKLKLNGTEEIDPNADGVIDVYGLLRKILVNGQEFVGGSTDIVDLGNVVKEVSLNNTTLTIDSGKVDIPLATDTQVGVIKKSTTLSGYGITDTYTKTEVDDRVSGLVSADDLASVATSGSYNDLSNKPTIPSSDTVKNWGFYIKPADGIPHTDLGRNVQDMLNKANMTIDRIVMNGTDYVPQGSETHIDLGTVITEHQTIDAITGVTINRYAACSTSASTAAKTASITSGTFTLEKGAKVSVKFSNANTASNPTLNINSKGAKNIYHNGSRITTGDNKALLAGLVDFVYDGTQWHLVGNYINTDTKVTSVANHYSPSQDSSSELSAQASGGSAGWGLSVVSGVTLQRDSKGHVTGIEVESSKFPAQPTLLQGESGATFTPSVDTNGNISWTNDKGLTNPTSRNIKGPKGDTGENGTNGTNGTDGVSVSSVTQTTTSTADGGDNVVTVTLSNGTKSTFKVKNGSKGSSGTNGTNGKDGATFTPSVTSAGILSWTNNNGLTNPNSVNIKGPKGDTGVGISKVQQTKQSSVSGDTNTITVTLSDGSTSTFNVTNGVQGNDGVTYTPSVNSSGVLSWTNDGGLPNPSSVNIKGPKGDTGAAPLFEIVTTTTSTNSGNKVLLGETWLPNKKYVITDKVDGVYSLSLQTPTENYAEYHMSFTTSSTLCPSVFPSSFLWANGTAPVIEANTSYELSVVATKVASSYVYKAILTSFKAI